MSESPKIPTAAARVLMVGVREFELQEEEQQALSLLRPGGLILFARNLAEPTQCADLIDACRPRLAPEPLIALDQEGGDVSRLKRFVGDTPSASLLTRKGPGATARLAGLTADALRGLGFNVNFAPVVDLSEPEARNGIANRSFSLDPQVVIEHAGAFLDELQRRGVAGCLKHFPGLGDTVVDSHVELPQVMRDRETLLAHDLAPFRALSERSASVMIGHGYYPALSGDQVEAASGSRTIAHELLREELGYEGLAFSDDLEMGAVSNQAPGPLAVRTLEAGCDCLLFCHSLDRAFAAKEALLERAAANEAFAERLLEAEARILRLARAYPAAEQDLSSWLPVVRGFGRLRDETITLG